MSETKGHVSNFCPQVHSNWHAGRDPGGPGFLGCYMEANNTCFHSLDGTLREAQRRQKAAPFSPPAFIGVQMAWIENSYLP